MLTYPLTRTGYCAALLAKHTLVQNLHVLNRVDPDLIAVLGKLKFKNAKKDITLGGRRIEEFELLQVFGERIVVTAVIIIAVVMAIVAAMAVALNRRGSASFWHDSS